MVGFSRLFPGEFWVPSGLRLAAATIFQNSMLRKKVIIINDSKSHKKKIKILFLFLKQ